MPTFGSNPGSFDNFEFTTLNNQNEVATLATAPATGTITSVSVFFAGQSGPVTAQLCVWDGSGNLLGASAFLGIGGGSDSVGGQSLVTANVGASIVSGLNYYIGFWRDPQAGAVWSFLNAGGTFYTKTSLTGSASNFFSPSSNTGGIRAFATYTVASAQTANIYVRRSGAWVAAPTQVRRSGAWTTTATVFVRRNGTWVQVQ